MSDLDRALAARIAAHRPDGRPPFDELRRRRRQRSTRTVAAATGTALVAAGVLVTPLALRDPDPVALRPADPAASSPTATTPVFGDRAAYDRWRARGGPDYTIRFTRNCFCPQLGPITITVRDRKVVRPAGLEFSAGLKSVDDLFTLILSGQADRIEVSYDPVYGYPRSIDADMIVNAIDDEVHYRLTDYRPLP